MRDSSGPGATFRARAGHVGGESGQTFAEYAVVLGAIAFGCIVAVLFLGGGVTDLFGSTARPLAPGTHQPPVPSELPYPTRLEECADDGWRDFPQFADEAACREYVESLSP